MRSCWLHLAGRTVSRSDISLGVTGWNWWKELVSRSSTIAGARCARCCSYDAFDFPIWRKLLCRWLSDLCWEAQAATEHSASSTESCSYACFHPLLIARTSQISPGKTSAGSETVPVMQSASLGTAALSLQPLSAALDGTTFTVIPEQTNVKSINVEVKQQT